MINTQEILILNTGGTFNKIYNVLNGELFVPKNEKSIIKIIKTSKMQNVKTDGLIYKDSLDINKEDRKILLHYINNSNFSKIIIVHGTDTMDRTAKYLAKKTKDKQIVLTGAMKPFSINPIEATSNLMMAYGFLLANEENNIFISMHGLVKKYNKIQKIREIGVFVCLM